MNEKLKELRKKAMALPLSPGVYIMKNKNRDIIYIGKAKALKNRVSQYFGSQNNHPEKVRRMVENVADFEYIITDSEFEALILECSLIKQHTPKYNILLKDDKGYSYVRVTNEEWRRISYVLQKGDDDATYIGPYKSSYYVKNSVEQAQKIFMLPTCNRRFPEDFKKGRPCLNFHIKQCCAPCTGKVKLSEYNEAVDEALDFLKGSDAKSIKKLTDKMIGASENLDFERAAKIRDQINSIKKMRDKQKVVNTTVEEQDVIAFASNKKKGSFEVFRFANGRLFDRENFIVDDPGDENTAREEFLLRYYTLRNDIPKYIVLDKEVESKEILEQWLSEKRQKRAYITVPQKGEQKHLIDMCLQNAFEALGQLEGIVGKQYAVLEGLKDILGLKEIPYYIESYDISNTQGSENVAGMVVFENAKPKKSAYKKFKIKSVAGQDDYHSMAEVLTRRFLEYKKAKENNESADSGFAKLPDLILLDGGKGQVSAVKEVLSDLGIDVPLFGMVKDERHRTRAIVSAQGEIAIRPNQSVFSFVTSIQDEVHRFAIGYHRQSRKKSMTQLTLNSIEGIGEVRAKALLKHFRTLDNIKKASLKELENAPKMTHDSAYAVYRHFHSNISEE
ncbi:MAG: excinuclease ABC subunit UvrC [Ruminococcaceae bacterium]|nr:excinuclease ABC subunit UvrC [Oscillospiraceae bacterium]